MILLRRICRVWHRRCVIARPGEHRRRNIRTTRWNKKWDTDRFNTDYWNLRLLRRTAKSTVLSTAKPFTRSRRIVFTSSPIRLRRTRRICAMEHKLSTTFHTTAGCPPDYRPIDGPQRTSFTRVYISSNGARSSTHKQRRTSYISFHNQSGTTRRGGERDGDCGEGQDLGGLST